MSKMIDDQGRKTCERCGTCCTKGGPALHADDLPLVRDHWLDLSDLITIRVGEPVFSPLVNGIEPSRTELVKVSGQNESWTCRFFSQTKNGCGIYPHRPLECRLLKCWDPAPLTKVIYQQCLKRQDVLGADEELLPLIEIQEEHCTFASIAGLTAQFTENRDSEILTEIARIVILDLNIRQQAIQRRGLNLADELLLFGRPLFKSLSFYHLALQEGPQGLQVIPSPSP